MLFVNSIGMRVPAVREGAMFRRRIARKLRSLRRGLMTMRPLCGVDRGGAAGIGRHARQAAGSAAASAACGATLNIEKPLLIGVAVPTVTDALDRLPAAGLVYQRTDRFESFRGADSAEIAALT